MAVLTALSIDDARRLGAAYGLEVLAVTGILAGSVNSNYALDLAAEGPSGRRRAFLRVYEEQGDAGAQREADLLDRLALGGVATPRPLTRSDGGFLGQHAGKPVAVFPWVDGEVLCQSRVTSHHARAVGAALGRVHVAGASIACRPSERFGPAALLGRLAGLPDEARTGAIGQISERMRALLESRARSTPALAEGLVHGDLFRDNVLWQQGEIRGLLDFESASRGPFAFDLAVTLLAWCFGATLDLDLGRAMVGGYGEVRPLGEAERAGLWGEAVFAAVRFTVTRITDFELRPRGTGIYKDFRRFVARLDALEALGPRGLRAGLGLA